MKTEPIVPARIDWSGAVPFSPEFGDRYHAEAGALEQAAHVFLRGNGLPQRWAGRRRFVIVETGFGLGNNFLATWDAWRRDAQHCERLDFVSLDCHPPMRADLERAHAASPLRELADALIAAWPPLTPNLHALDFGSLRLLLGFGDVHRLLPALVLSADAFYLDGFAPARNPAMWDRRVLHALGRVAAPGATAATWSVAREVRDGLHSAGFGVERDSGFAGKRAMTRARFAPAFVPKRAPARLANAPATRQAVIVGAGIAGACCAAALSRHGWRCVVVDRHAQPGTETSGNPAAIVHGTVHADDGVHARFTRAAALHAQRHYGAAIAAGRLCGHLDGLVRRGAVPGPIGPPEYVRAVDDGLFFPGGGWVVPRDAICAAIESPSVEFRGGIAVKELRRDAESWQLLGASGEVVASAPVVVIASASTAAGLIGPHGDPGPASETVRGQITWFDSPPAPKLALPAAGDGYAIGMGGRILCGAASAPRDAMRELRDTDHAFNLERLARLTGLVPPPGAVLHGRVGWRERTADRLPIVGAIPQREWPPGTRLDQVRFVPRVPGLFRLGALGGRGFTWAPLAAEVLAALIDGAPVPLEADLLDAIDPARAIVRAARRQNVSV